MQYLPRLRVAVIVHLVRLPFAQDAKGTARKVRIHHQVLQTHDQAVAAEHGYKPGHASGWNEFVRLETHTRQAQRRHVFHRLPEEPIHILVGTSHGRRNLSPLTQFPLNRAPRISKNVDAPARRLRCCFPSKKLVLATGMPGTSRLEIDQEADSPIAVVSRAPAVRQPCYNGTL